MGILLTLLPLGAALWLILKTLGFANGNRFGTSIMGGKNNFLGMGKIGEQPKRNENKIDPYNNIQQNSNTNITNNNIKTYDQFNPNANGYNDGTLQINVGDNEINKIVLQGNEIKRALDQSKEFDKPETDKIDIRSIKPEYSEQKAFNTEEINSFPQTVANVPEKRQLKDFAKKFPDVKYKKTGHILTQMAREPMLASAAEFDEIEEISDKRKIVPPTVRLLDNNRKIIPSDISLIDESEDINVGNLEIDSLDDIPVLNYSQDIEPIHYYSTTDEFKTLSTKDISESLKLDENKGLRANQIAQMNRITKALKEQDRVRMLSKKGHVPYLEMEDIYQLQQNEKLYNDIYRRAQLNGRTDINSVAKVREIANKVIEIERDREIKVLKLASREEEKRLPIINRETLYKKFSERAYGEKMFSEDDMSTQNFLMYMRNYIDLDEVEPSESEKKEYREQAKRNVEARGELSPEAIEEEYNRIYQQKQEEKMLDAIFSSDSNKVTNAIDEIISKPEIGIEIFGADTYKKIIQEIKENSDYEAAKIFDKIRDNLLATEYGEHRDYRKERKEAREEKKKAKREADARARRDSFYTKFGTSRNADINNALGMTTSAGKKEEPAVGFIAPISVYTPHVGSGYKENTNKSSNSNSANISNNVSNEDDINKDELTKNIESKTDEN